MALIKNAIEQGKQAINSMAKRLGRTRGDRIDILIVGAGPSGISLEIRYQERLEG